MMDHRRMIKHEEMIEIAEQWSSGEGCPLYQFSNDTGQLEDAGHRMLVLVEIEKNLLWCEKHEMEKDAKALRTLAAYVTQAPIKEIR